MRRPEHPENQRSRRQSQKKMRSADVGFGGHSNATRRIDGMLGGVSYDNWDDWGLNLSDSDNRSENCLMSTIARGKFSKETNTTI